MEHDELKELLDGLHDRYNAPDFIADDPISVPHRFERREDIEISGFLAATIAWGNRKSIVRNAGRLMRLMDDAPYDFTVHASEQELNALLNFVQRSGLHRLYSRPAPTMQPLRKSRRLFRTDIRRHGRSAHGTVAVPHDVLGKRSSDALRKAPLQHRQGRGLQTVEHVSQMDGAQRQSRR